MLLPQIILPWNKTSKLSGNGRLHWRGRNNLVAAQKRTADALAREAGWHKFTIPEGARINVSLVYCPPSNVSTVDDDNVIAAFKGSRDALAAVLRVDDSRFKVKDVVRGEKTKNGAVIVEAELFVNGE